MSRAAIISVGLCLGALPAHAQGVPTQDNSAIGRAIARVTALAEDLGVQQDKDRTESTLSEVQADQLRVLELQLLWEMAEFLFLRLLLRAVRWACTRLLRSLARRLDIGETEATPAE